MSKSALSPSHNRGIEFETNACICRQAASEVSELVARVASLCISGVVHESLKRWKFLQGELRTWAMDLTIPWVSYHQHKYYSSTRKTAVQENCSTRQISFSAWEMISLHFQANTTSIYKLSMVSCLHCGPC